jgi:diguanylate cyclase (GGDEF)-like protein
MNGDLPKEATPVVNPESQRTPAKLITRRAQKRTLNETRRALAEAEADRMTDQLTGLKNLRWFDNQLQDKIDISIRNPDATFWFELMDVDDFKRFNDVDYAVGDKVLQSFGQIGNRPGEDIARRGGDEFAQLVDGNISDEDVKKVAIRNAQRFFELSHNSLISDSDAVAAGIDQATISIALVKYQPGMDAESMLKSASKLIKESKAKAQKDSIFITNNGGLTAQEFHRE